MYSHIGNELDLGVWIHLSVGPRVAFRFRGMMLVPKGAKTKAHTLHLLKGLIDELGLRQLLQLLLLLLGYTLGFLGLGRQGSLLGTVASSLGTAYTTAESNAAEGQYAQTTEETNNGSKRQVVTTEAEAVAGGNNTQTISLIFMAALPGTEALRSFAFFLIIHAAQFYYDKKKRTINKQS